MYYPCSYEILPEAQILRYAIISTDIIFFLGSTDLIEKYCLKE